MSEKMKCELTCDRCGFNITTDGQIIDDAVTVLKRPESWTWLRHFFKNPRHEGDSKHDLCPKCSIEFDNWMKMRDWHGRPLRCKVDGCKHPNDSSGWCEFHNIKEEKST